MAGKDYTIMVMRATAKMRTFRLSVKTIKVFAAAVGISSCLFVFLGYKYISNKSGTNELDMLREDYNRKQLELRNLAKSFEYLNKEMDSLKKFNRKFRIVAGLPQADENIQQTTGLGGETGDNYSDFSQQRKDQFIQNMHKEIDQLRRSLQNEQDALQELAESLSDRKSLLASTPSIWPVRGWLTSGFGYRTSPFTGQKEFHQGIDISSRFGLPVRSPAEGIVTFAGRNSGLGNVVIVEHGFGYSTRFGHNSKLVVTVGERVKRNQILAYVGSTGHSTGPHVHYEVRINGVPVNPFDYILN